MDSKAISDRSEHSPSDFSMLARRDEATAQLETLRKERGAVLLDGGSFDDTALREAERQLDALSDIEAVAVAREREAAAQAYREHIDGLRAKLVRLDRQRASSVERAEEAAQALAVCLKNFRDHTAEIEKLVRSLGGSVPPGMSSAETEKRMSRRLGVTLSALIGHNNRFGDVQFRPALNHERGPWKEGEALLSAGMIESAMKGK